MRADGARFVIVTDLNWGRKSTNPFSLARCSEEALLPEGGAAGPPARTASDKLRNRKTGQAAIVAWLRWAAIKASANLMPIRTECGSLASSLLKNLPVFQD